MVKRPLDFRKEEVRYVMQRWKQGDSCSLIGVGSAGKTNLLQHLLETDVQRQYLNEQQPNINIILIDSNLLGPLPSLSPQDDAIRAWVGYELLMHRLFITFYPFERLSIRDRDALIETYHALQDGRNPTLLHHAVRYLELAIQLLLQEDERIIFIFDEFEWLLEAMPVKFYQTLRGIRDAHKRQLAFTAFTRAPLDAIIKRMGLDSAALEPFTELFHDHICYIGPYNEQDAKAMMQELQRRSNHVYTDDILRTLRIITGNYAGLMRTGFYALPYPLERTLSQDTMTQLLIDKEAPRIEVETLWKGLTDGEKRILKSVVKRETYKIDGDSERVIAMLMQKHLLILNKSNQQLEVTPPLLTAFIMRMDSSVR